MSNIYTLSGEEIKNSPAHKDVVSMLERYLAMAKRGEISSIAIAAYDSLDGSTVHGVSEEQHDIPAIVCALERVKLALLLDQN